MTKFLKVFAICLFLNKIHGLSSYQSSIKADGRPILRTAIDEPEPPEPESELKREPRWLGELLTRIERLVSRHGYDSAKPRIRKAVEDTERKESVLLDVKVERDGGSKITYEYNRKDPLRSKTEDPDKDKWAENVEKLVVAVLDTYPKNQIEKQLKPAIRAIEKERNIRISDIDVNLTPNGKVEVEIKQVGPKSKKPLRKPRSPNHGKENRKDVTTIFE